GTVDIGVIANGRVQQAAEQIVGRHSEGFSANVPQRLLDPAQRNRRGAEVRALENLRLSLRAQPFDIVNAAAFHQLEELLDVANSSVVRAAVRSVSDARQACAGADARDQPVAAGVYFHDEDFQTRNGYSGHIAVRRS